MTLRGATYGAIGGIVSGVAVFFFVLGLGAFLAIPQGLIFGVAVGAVVAFICGLVTVWFDARSAGATRIYRRSMAILCTVLTPIGVFLIFQIQFHIGPNSAASWLIPLALMILGALFAVYFSRNLVNIYIRYFGETEAAQRVGNLRVE